MQLRLRRYATANAELASTGSSCGRSLIASRIRLWKRELQKLANETGPDITVTHLPPGTSKWNKIEHRLLAFITQNWRGKPLVSHQVIIQLIAATKTDTGLSFAYNIDHNLYPKGIKVSKKEMAELNIEYHSFHGEWNYTIRPKPHSQ
jgi:hypothetical protein